VCVYVCVYVCVRVYVCARVYMRACTCVCACVHVCECVCACVARDLTKRMMETDTEGHAGHGRYGNGQREIERKGGNAIKTKSDTRKKEWERASRGGHRNVQGYEALAASV